MRTGRSSRITAFLFAAAAVFAMFFSSAASAAGHIAVIQDYNGVLNNLHPKDDFTALVNMQNVTNAFYMQDGIEDDFDFLFVFLKGTANVLLHAEAAPRGFTAQQAGQGTGAPAPDSSPANFGSNGKLKLVGDMFIVDAFPTDPTAAYIPLGNPLLGEGSPQAVFSGVEWMARVAGRYWMSYAKYGSGKGDLLDNASDPKNWSFFFSNGGSVMGGNKFRDDGQNRWMIMDEKKMYTTLDQYLMGMIGPDEVIDENHEYFTIIPEGSDYKRTDLPKDGGGYMEGARGDTITINDLVSANGAMNPDHTQSQKDFRCAFILVVPQGSSAMSTDLDKLEVLRNKFQLWFNQNTSLNGHMDCTLDGSGIDGDVDGDEGGSDGDEDNGECVPDTKRCKNDVVEMCDVNHNWQFVQDCGSEDMVCSGGECVSEGCTETPGGASSCSGTCCDPTFKSCLGNSLCTCNFDSGNGEGTYQSNSCISVCSEAGKDFDRCGEPEEGKADACICEGGVVSPDGDQTGTDGDEVINGECSPQTVFFDCDTNFRCLSNTCSPCPEGTERTGELNFCTEIEGGEEESSGGGCSSAAGAGLWLALLGLTAFSRRRNV